MSRHALRTGLCRYGRETLPPRPFAPRTTDSTYGQRCAPHSLRDQPRPTPPNRVWVSGLTYLSLTNGAWVYLWAFQGLCIK